ncbi:Short-chain dehydrogenase/reductase 2b [Mycena indigotica]|uniref:Short-chain dehydrogenase/reductase 2b n=1 Tax=Mycena indigotica TaxID=2126181 RepID=A0A8H6WBH1_9AGAR|nr:Short-chain dehydrogenase/reductase 2b [Mycena indigotica]KAF7312614.1 Short-chain dehydrogenase/reductase 2b [Mycena indigotica]
MSSEKKIVFITGANTGLGYETVKALYASPESYHIVVGTRTLSNGEDAITRLKSEVPNSSSTLSTVQIDITSDASIEAALATIKSDHGKLDVLINNAGAALDGELTPTTPAAQIRSVFNKTWDLNVSSPHVLTTLAMPLLLESSDARLVFMSSGTASIWETLPENWGNMHHLPRLNASPEKGWPKPANSPISRTAYRSAKAGLNMLMREWARVLKDDSVKLWGVSPGFLATGLGGHGREMMLKMGAEEPSVGGEFLRDIVQGKYDHQVGKVIRAQGIQPW